MVNFRFSCYSTQYYCGSGNIMGMHPDAMQSVGVYSAISKELKPESTRSLPYPCSTDGLLVNNGKPTVGSFFKNLDNHRLQNYGIEKFPHAYRIQNADHEKCSYSQKIAADVFQHSNFKLLDHDQNLVPTQRESDYVLNSGCSNPVSQAALLVSPPENHSTCADIPSENDFVTNRFMVENVVSNLKSEDTNNKNSILVIFF